MGIWKYQSQQCVRFINFVYRLTVRLHFMVCGLQCLDSLIQKEGALFELMVKIQAETNKWTLLRPVDCKQLLHCNQSLRTELTAFLRNFSMAAELPVLSKSGSTRFRLSLFFAANRVDVPPTRTSQRTSAHLDASLKNIYQFYQLATTKTALVPHDLSLILINFPLKDNDHIFNL